MDVDTIEPGQDFVEVIEEAVSSCDVLISLIGERWLDVRDGQGNRRLENPNDFVRLEIAAALKRKIRVIPVLLHGTSMPRQENLPDNLVPLSRRNALEIRHSSFNIDIGKLQAALEKYFQSEASPHAKPVEPPDQDEKASPNLDVSITPSPNPVSLGSVVNWTFSIANRSASPTKKITVIHKRKILSDGLILTPGETQWISFQQNYSKLGEHSESVFLIGSGVSQEVSASVDVIQPPELELSLEPERETIEPDEKVNWIVRIKNIGLDDLNHVLIYNDRELFADPFDLAVGERRVISFSKSYQQEGVTTERIDVSGMTKIGERVQFDQDAKIQVGSSSRKVSGDSASETQELLVLQKHYPMTIDSPIHLEFARIPAGGFYMGSHEDHDKDLYDRETPQHRVKLNEFFIGKTPVTNGQYNAFLEATGYQAPPDWSEAKYKGEMETHPVVNVSWYDAIAFCEWLTEHTGKRFSLPSEAEWEKAARGVFAKLYPWGNKWEQSLCNTQVSKIQGTTPVGHYSPEGDSPYGCIDMAGNVWEWTRSLYGDNPIEPSYGYPYDPADGREDLEAPNNILRVVRGGAWCHSPIQARCAYRGRYYPEVKLDRRGFRVVILS
jgi:formylglycine-generating enzyme required for sulfatase activity